MLISIPHSPFVVKAHDAARWMKIGGFSFFTTEDDRNALDYIAFRQKYEKQNVVRAALHQFLKQHYKEGQGLDAESMRIIEQYEDSVYQWV